MAHPGAPGTAGAPGQELLTFFLTTGIGTCGPARRPVGDSDIQPQPSEVGPDDVGGLFHSEWFCDSVTFPPLGCKGVKAHGFLRSGSLHGGSRLLWGFVFVVVVWLLHHDFKDLVA